MDNAPAPALAAEPSAALLAQMRMANRASLFAKLPLFAAFALAAAIIVGGWLWTQTPDMRVLYSNLSDKDGGAVVAALVTMNVPYKVADGGGAILVPAAQVHETRLRLASLGLPKGSVVGMELVDNQKFGATQFQEQMNFQRGLEGELARSIQTLAAVQAARVHLAIPKPSVFLREQEGPTASVLLTLNTGRTLDRAQVSGIAHLVASSVPGLAIDKVSIVDQNGSLLSQRKDGTDNGLDPTQLSYVRQIEQSTNQRIVDILEPLIGRNNVRAQVTADVDFTRNESMAESFKPNTDPKNAALRNQTKSDSSTAGAGGAQGVPGALSNQPPGNASAPLDKQSASSASTASNGPVSTRSDQSQSYEVDKKIEHTKAPVGNVRRMTAAVVVNFRRTVDKDGKATSAALAPQEMEQINALVREAMGFSKERGDSLNVVNAAFNEPEKFEAPEVPMWKRPETIEYAKDGGKYVLFAAIILYLLFGVVKPMLREARERAAALPPPPQLAGPAPEPEGGGDGAAEGVVVDPLVRARQLARDDPKIVANVVKSWVAKDG